jgi:hypothetical protein
MANESASLAAERGDESEAFSVEDDVFDILQNDRRRMAILALAADDSGIPIDRLARQIAVEETDEEDPPDRAYKSAYVGLQQTHVPKLVEAEVVWFDDQQGLLYPGPRLDDVAAYLDPPTVHRQRISLEFGLGLAGLVASGSALAGVPVVSALPGAYWAMLFLAAVFVVSLSRYVSR